MRSLHDACRAGDTERVKKLLDEGAPLDEKDKYGDTALMDAILNGHTEVVRLLLDKGALLDEKDKYGDTALMLASKHGHTEVVKLLFQMGALVDEKSNGGIDALPSVVSFDEDQLGCLAAAHVHRRLPQGQSAALTEEVSYRSL